jgi:poly(3-hydroxybutyrate) depolymerase
MLNVVQSKWLSDDDADLKVDDKSFIADLIDGLTERLCIDTNRIHMTGLGTGAGLSHLMACDSFWSNNTASFALVNPTLLAGLVMQRGVKDEITLLWEKCKPARVPIKLLEIHGENNTFNSYWGKSVAKRGRLPTVQWLVEWAMRNDCGDAKGMPTKENENDMLYKTELASGTIYEGQVHAGKLQRAMYRCYALTPEEQVEKYIGTFQVIEPEAEKMTPLNKDGKEEEEKADRGDIILEHLFVKNYAHGWPRIAMKDGATETFETAEMEETADAPIFDATKEVLKWFNQHKLSDDSRAPGVATNVEPVLDDDAIAKLVAGITAQVENQKKVMKENSDDKGGLEETSSEDTKETEQEEGNKVEEKSEGKDRIKDEL